MMLHFIRAGGDASRKVHELLNDPTTAKPTGSREEHWTKAHLVRAASARQGPSGDVDVCRANAATERLWELYLVLAAVVFEAEDESSLGKAH